MSFEITSLYSSLIQKQAVAEIERCNDFTAQFRLTLSHNDAFELVETRTLALKPMVGLNLGGGSINKIIKEFCDSPYISMYNYAETLHELTEIFIFIKMKHLI